MKKFKNILICTLALSATVSSCKKSFLDEPPTSQISAQQIAAAAASDPSLLNSSLNGLYAMMYTAGIGGTTGHDDFGQKGVDIYTDMLSADMVLGNTIYGWYTTIERNTASKDYTSNPVYVPWRYYYKEVLAANTIIDALGGTDVVPPTATTKAYMGQAKAMRAYAYFNMANLYSGANGAMTDKILPIYTNTKQSNQPAATAADVYAFIIKDLTDAAGLLDANGAPVTTAPGLLNGFTRTAKNQINQDVAKGLLAYAYAARGTAADLQQVVYITNALLAKYPLTTASQAVPVFDSKGAVTNPESGFNSLTTPSWMWGYDVTLSTSLDLISFWGQVDIFTYSYAWAGDPKFIDKSLYDNIRSTDIRKNQFSDYAPDPYGGLLPIGKFFDPARVEGGQRSVITDLLYMRIDEMQLLNAEAQVRLGNDALARTSLGKLVSLRYSTADYAAYATYLATLSGTTLGTTTGQSAAGVSVSLLEEIYLQTRIELWGEGKTFLALKRNKHNATKGSNHLFNVGSTYKYNSAELTFPIPSVEVLFNPNLNK